MAAMQSQSIPSDQFLLMSVNLLHKAFLEASRTDAKNLYKALAEGTLVRLTTVQMEDKSTLGVNLSLDHSEFRGKLNFGAFRASVGALIGKVGQTLKEEQDYPMFGGDEEGGAMIFGITGLTVEEQQPNVMVLASQTLGSDASVTLKLMYLDPSQFLEQAT
jgi:hypothetical protein